MGNRNYSNFSRNYNNRGNNENKEVVETNNEIINEEVVSNDPMTEVFNEVMGEIVNNEVNVIETSETERLIAKGFVTGCERLNVREEAKKDSKVLCIINKADEVVVTVKESTDDFYKVCTSSGVEGYCMKKFISIK